MKIAIVVQRYGKEIHGGAELHCKYIVDHLKVEHSIEVLTTCARDYLTWQNEYEPGIVNENEVTIRRFPVTQVRNLDRFDNLSYLVNYCSHTLADELDWLDEHGPRCPSLIDFIKMKKSEYDIFIFFSYRYATVYHGLPEVAEKSILVPTAENDRIINLSIYQEFFHLPAAIAYNSREEREMIQNVTGNNEVPGVVVGVGLSDAKPEPMLDLCRKFDLRRKYMVYVGRLEAVKGCQTLSEFFLRFSHANQADFDLVFLGSGNYQLPKHATILHLENTTESEKMGIISGAETLIIPSPYESLSMVVLEAWAMKRPIIANGDCPVLRGQCIRSNGGLYYRNYDEFEIIVTKLMDDEAFSQTLGNQGYKYYCNNYRWPVIMEKYKQLFRMI